MCVKRSLSAITPLTFFTPLLLTVICHSFSRRLVFRVLVLFLFACMRMPAEKYIYFHSSMFVLFLFFFLSLSYYTYTPTHTHPACIVFVFAEEKPFLQRLALGFKSQQLWSYGQEKGRLKDFYFLESIMNE